MTICFQIREGNSVWREDFFCGWKELIVYFWHMGVGCTLTFLEGDGRGGGGGTNF